MMIEIDEDQRIVESREVVLTEIFGNPYKCRSCGGVGYTWQQPRRAPMSKVRCSMCGGTGSTRPQ